jgi:3-oxoacyl-[acyl-carrier protein] reductase
MGSRSPLLSGRIAIVTGAARGIGRGIALAFAQEGAAVMLVDRDEEPLQDAAAACAAFGSPCRHVVADVNDEPSVEAFVEGTMKGLGGLDILVNNAAVSSSSEVVDLTTSEWDRIITTDLTSVFLSTRAALPWMIEQRFGRIINIGSQLATKGAPTVAHYCAAKGGVHGFTRAVAWEVGKYNITANVIAPGPVETDMLADDPEDFLAEKIAGMPVGRIGRVEEVAPTAVLLASDGGAFYTGSTLNVSGGDVM